MFAIAFDLVVADTQNHHPKGVTQAYADIKVTLAHHGFDWVQGSLYVNQGKTWPSFSPPSWRSNPCPGSRPA